MGKGVGGSGRGGGGSVTAVDSRIARGVALRADVPESFVSGRLSRFDNNTIRAAIQFTQANAFSTPIGNDSRRRIVSNLRRELASRSS